MAVLGLSAFVASGGAIGATVTAESTIANNTITVTQAQAEVFVIGDPMTIEWSTVQTNETSGAYTVTNKGKAVATVKLSPVTGVAVPSRDGTIVEMKGYLNGSDFSFFRQDLQDGATDPGMSFPFDLNPGESVVVDIRVKRRGLSTPLPYSATFDLAFDYVTKG
ncbi:MAG: hypothetical protein WBA87_05570 [Microbacterium sp.]